MCPRTVFDASDWLLWTSARRRRHVSARTELTIALGSRLFHLALPLRLFSVGPECKICLSVCGRYTVNCGIPPHQSKILKSTALEWEDATDLNYCVVFVDRVGVFLEHMHRTLRAFARLPRRFSLFCLSFASRSKHRNRCNLRLKSESVTGQFRNQSS